MVDARIYTNRPSEGNGMPNVHPKSPRSTIAPDNLSTTGKTPVRTEERIMELVFVSCSFLLSGLLFFFLF